MLTQKQNLILQSYFSTAFILELKNNNFLESDFFKSMKFGFPWIKTEIEKIGIDNQGLLLMALYSMLVIPKQLIQDQFKDDYNKINVYLDTVTVNTQTDYQSDSSSINYLQHIRNAVAHSRVSFSPTISVKFSDERKNYNTNKKDHFSTEIPLKSFGKFLMELQKIHLKYISVLQSQQ